MAGRIILIDPVATNRIVMRSILSSACHSVFLCETIEEALSISASAKPDAIICAQEFDAKQAGLLRAASGSCNPALIAVTAETISARLAAFDAGADDVLSRPIDATLLLARIRKAMRHRIELATLDAWTGLQEAASEFVPERRLLWIDRGQRAPLGMSQISVKDALMRSTHHAKNDVFVVPVSSDDPGSGWLLLSELRTHHPQALCIVSLSRHDGALAAQALDLGAGDVFDGFTGTEEQVHRLKKLRPAHPLVDKIDPATGLPTRASGLRALATVARGHSPAAVLLLETASLADMRAHFGETLAQTALTSIIAQIRRNMHKGDHLSCYDDTRFLLIARNTGSSEARRLALMLRHHLQEAPVFCEVTKQNLPLALFAGIAVSRGPAGDDATALLKQAETALSQARTSTRDPVQICRSAA